MQPKTSRRELKLTLVAAFLVVGTSHCSCPGAPGSNQNTKDACEKQGLEYREKDGTGYCYEKGSDTPIPSDCATAPSGTPCNDGDACTHGDACDDVTKTCVGTPLTGMDDNNPCTEDKCDPATGVISHDPVPMNGTTCNDGDVCSANDKCTSGVCRGNFTVDASGRPIDDGDACTRDACNAQGARVNTPYTPAEAAALGLGGLTLADVSNPCKQYVCQVGALDTPHVTSLHDVSCADPAAGRTNGACANWKCNQGTCTALINESAVQSAPVSTGTNLAPACRMRACNTATGSVVYQPDPRAVGGPCEDGNGCTFEDTCRADGSCGGRELVHGAPCEDGNACTRGDYCHASACRPGVDYLALANQQPDPLTPNPLDAHRDPAGILASSNPCRAYACVPGRGVVVIDVDGVACDDRNPCTTSSACQGGECVGARPTLADGTPCTHPERPCVEGACDKGVCLNFHGVTDQRACQPLAPTGDAACRAHACTSAGLCVSGDPDPSRNGTVCTTFGECSVGLCTDGTCTRRNDHLEGQPCRADVDSRCNAPACIATGTCVLNPSLDAPCTLLPEEVAPGTLPCVTGICRAGPGGAAVCSPHPVQDDTPCDDRNPCNGEDWCRAGHCVERYVSDDPTHPAPGSAECTNILCYDNLVPGPNGPSPCDVDGDPATVGVCKYDGTCTEISRVVDDTNDCTVPAWNTEAGRVDLLPVPNGMPCHVVRINPCLENRAVCVDGVCHADARPDGTPCDLVGQAVPEGDALPVGHVSSCYQEVCMAGQCVVSATWRNGAWCDDGETTCTFPGTCGSGQCAPSDTPRGYGERCTAPEQGSFVDPAGRPLAPRDRGCWGATECSESGTCAVRTEMLPDNTPCDFTSDGDTCDGKCVTGLCTPHDWTERVPGHVCPDDDNSCTVPVGCSTDPLQLGNCVPERSLGDHVPTESCQGVDPANPCATLECVGGACVGHPLDGDVEGCQGPVENNPCRYQTCAAGACVTRDVNPAHHVPCQADQDPCTLDVCYYQDEFDPSSAVVCRAFLPDAVQINLLRCDVDANPCTADRCAYVNPGDPFQGVRCVADTVLPAGTACGDDLDDTDANCTRGVCQPDGGGNMACVGAFEVPGSPCQGDETNTCVSTWACGGLGRIGNGRCVPSAVPDGYPCDTNGAPCDEACLDVDGPDGPVPPACKPFSAYQGLLTSARLATDENEQTACRRDLDPTFDPETPGSGNTCARFVCYLGSCRAWDATLPGGLLAGGPSYGAPLGPNPANGQPCGDSGECTRGGRCLDNACTGYSTRPDGTACGAPHCTGDGSAWGFSSCQAGACVARDDVAASCTMGTTGCLANRCVGASCPYGCEPGSFDYVNAFEDISGGGPGTLALRTRLTSPISPAVSCPALRVGASPITERQRRACDDGSALVDLVAELGFPSPTADGDGFWFYNRRYRYISVSANGTVLFHRDVPTTTPSTASTLYVGGNLGGAAFNPDAYDQPGDPVNQGENAAQMRVFRDDLTLVTDVDVARDTVPTDPMSETFYGAFRSVGEIYAKRMGGPDGAQTQYDDYLVIQWDDVAFFGCAPDAVMRSHVTFQVKWWPYAGHVVFAYPHGVNDDGLLSTSALCVPGRVNGSDASVGLFDENGTPSHAVGQDGWLLTHDSGPGTDSFDAFFLFWPTNRPTTHYDWRGVEWFLDIARPVGADATAGTRLAEVSRCDSCCERVPLGPPVVLDGVPRDFMYVCADGYIHFTAPHEPTFNPASLRNEGDRMFQNDPARPKPRLQAAPFWSDLRLASSRNAGVFWADDRTGGQRRLIVQWDNVEYPARAGRTAWAPGVPMLAAADQERGEDLCTNRSPAGVGGDDDGDGLPDCLDPSCACAVACGGLGCGLTFQVIVHAGLGMVEMRYRNSAAEFAHAVASTDALFGAVPATHGTAIGLQQSGLHGPFAGVYAYGIDLLDGKTGGDTINPTSTHTRPLDAWDVDEAMPGAQRNIILMQNATLAPYGN
jgi:hypothetical protein